MKRILHFSCVVGVMALLLVCPAWSQNGGGGGGGSSGAGGSGGTGGSSGAGGSQAGRGAAGPGNIGNSGQPYNTQVQGPIYVEGRVVMDDGHPVPEPVSVALNCGMPTSKAVVTDLKGYFEFVLGVPGQENEDFSASNDASIAGGTLGSGSFSGPLGPYGAAGEGLTGCELRVSVPGYQPLNENITKRVDLGRVDVGTLQLTRLAGVKGSAISVTSLLVPDAARKEFERGEKEARNNHLKPAEEHMEKAVGQYDKYAAAWNELGMMYAADHEDEKSTQAFEKAIAADPKYTPSFVNLANLNLQEQKNDLAADNAEKALDLDPNIGFAKLVLAMADFNLGRFDNAEKNAKELEKSPHANLSQLHALLAEVYLRKQNPSSAAMEMRAYLKESPKGEFAPRLKDALQRIEKTAADAGAAAQPQTAP